MPFPLQPLCASCPLMAPPISVCRLFFFRGEKRSFVRVSFLFPMKSLPETIRFGHISQIDKDSTRQRLSPMFFVGFAHRPLTISGFGQRPFVRLFDAIWRFMAFISEALDNSFALIARIVWKLLSFSRSPFDLGIRCFFDFLNVLGNWTPPTTDLSDFSAITFLLGRTGNRSHLPFGDPGYRRHLRDHLFCSPQFLAPAGCAHAVSFRSGSRCLHVVPPNHREFPKAVGSPFPHPP